MSLMSKIEVGAIIERHGTYHLVYEVSVKATSVVRAETITSRGKQDVIWLWNDALGDGGPDAIDCVLICQRSP